MVLARWTFQEYLFSRRRVVFQNYTVNWECLECACHKAQDMGKLNPIKRKVFIQHNEQEAPMGFRFSSWPDMARYARMVPLFNQRQLTYPEDVLKAFAGVLSLLCRKFVGSFISGLPEMCFDAALLWQPWTALSRRVDSRASGWVSQFQALWM